MKIYSILALAICLNLSAATESKVENKLGPKILFEQDSTSLISNISVAVLTGSSDDPVTKVGLTNMVGELVLRGTKKRSRNQFQSEMERMGASIGVSASHDVLIFSGEVIKENTGAFLKLIEEALLHPSFKETDFNELKTEILAEISHIKNANNRLGGLAMRKEFFAGTALERPIVGSLSTVNAIKLDDVRRAYNNNFDRAKLIFAVTSPLNEGEITESLTKIWSQFPDGNRVSKYYQEPKVPKTPTLVVVHKPNTSTGSMLFSQGGMTAQEAERHTLITGNFSFGGEPLVSRLFKTIRGELGWTYAIYTTYSVLGGLSNQKGVYSIISTPSVEFTSKTIFKTLAMWKDYMNKALDSTEMRLARESLVNSYPFEFESAEKRLSLRFNSYLYNVPILSQDEYADKIESIDNGKIRDALKKHHSEEGWLITLVADKDVVAKQLAEEQKDIPEEKRLKISKVLTPDQIIE